MDLLRRNLPKLKHLHQGEEIELDDDLVLVLSDLCYNILTYRVPLTASDVAALKRKKATVRELGYSLRGKPLFLRRILLTNNPSLTRILVKYGVKYGKKVRTSAKGSPGASVNSKRDSGRGKPSK